MCLVFVEFLLELLEDFASEKLMNVLLSTGAEDDVHHFVGNDTRTDYFRLMLRDGDSLLVGGR